jgi:mannose-6-phosphate isomerase-like protein (cupin superfamily)
MTDGISIENSFDKFSETFSPKIIGELNGQLFLLVRLEGDKVPWHTHDDEDEMFLVVDGVLDIYERDKHVTLSAGEFYIVQRGTEHRVVPQDHVKLILIEPASISHTGNVDSEITKHDYDRLIP